MFVEVSVLVYFRPRPCCNVWVSTLTFKIQTLLLPDGERMPLLHGPDLQPLYYPTLFITSQVRNAGRAANSVSAQLGSIKRLYTWATLRNVDLEERLALGDYFRDFEVEDLSRFVCEKQRRAFRGQTTAPSTLRSEKLHDGRLKAQSKYRHLMYLSSYLRWLSERLVEARSGHIDHGARAEICAMVAALSARKPRKASSSRLSARTGLTVDDQTRLVRTCMVRATENDLYPSTQLRDELIVRILLNLGIRAGELLSLKTDDFDFQASEVVIQRRPDDPTDPRLIQPVVKTCDRRLPVSDDLIRLVHDYILGPRRQFKRARRHAFLLVVHRKGPHEGLPLSIKGLTKIFRKLGLRSGLSGLTPHVLRHTANERFSELMDELHVTEAREEQMRSYAMGWRDGSGTAATYTRRHTATKAGEASKKLQRKLYVRK